MLVYFKFALLDKLLFLVTFYSFLKILLIGHFVFPAKAQNADAITLKTFFCHKRALN